MLHLLLLARSRDHRDGLANHHDLLGLAWLAGSGHHRLARCGHGLARGKLHCGRLARGELHHRRLAGDSEGLNVALGDPGTSGRRELPGLNGGRV